MSGAVFFEGTDYFTAAGSLVAASVMAGAIALLLDALPCLLRWKPEKVMEVLHRSMEPVETTDCLPFDETGRPPHPNYVYGYGKIRVDEVVDYVLASVSCIR